jgi:ABC-type polysaccharide/polyol phosphate transport system ATPase subunit
MAGIYKPDTGSIVRHCKSASLLSLGLGFDNELSGIDNAMILGMLLGARKSEVKAKLDEIVEFSELGRFINEPIKTYSSGMRSRLGFSVAVKMQTDLLLIDEVLSVGDASFKRKAEKAMMALIDSDQTVVFVSHGLEQVRKLCNRVVWLESGRIRRLGNTADVLSEYEASTDQQLPAPKRRP